MGRNRSTGEETPCHSKIDATTTGRIMAIIGRGGGGQIICWSEILRMNAESFWPNRGHIKMYVKRERNTLRNKKWIMGCRQLFTSSPKPERGQSWWRQSRPINGQWSVIDKGWRGEMMLPYVINVRQIVTAGMANRSDAVRQSGPNPEKNSSSGGGLWSVWC